MMKIAATGRYYGKKVRKRLTPCTCVVDMGKHWKRRGGEPVRRICQGCPYEGGLPVHAAHGF